ncbi:MAG: 50S ribosomal protein L3 [Pseudomonadota bacterium]
MPIGLVGRKVGMTRIFRDDGQSIPVTVIEVGSNRVSQVKTKETDGYSAIQMSFGKKRAIRVSKAIKGHLAKAGLEDAPEIMHEFRLDEEAIKAYAQGSDVDVSVFSLGQKVDVQGITKGKGFSGVIRRHNFSSNRASHGNSVSHRSVGSTGMAQDPGRVFPGKKMPGQYGSVTRTVQKLEIIKIDEVRKLLLVKGSTPGADGSFVIVHPSVKVVA